MVTRKITHLCLSDDDIARLLDMAIHEDGQDITSLICLEKATVLEAEVVAKQSGVLCGVAVACELFRRFDTDANIESFFSDGQSFQKGDRLLHLSMNGRGLLRAERPALNFLQQLSGVSTLTKQYVDKLAGTRTRLLDTRKTLPGWRRLQKYAVRIAGGYNHRERLDDMVMIKDNHLKVLGGELATIVDKIRYSYPNICIEAEVQSVKQLEAIVPLPIDRIMLDNMQVEEVARAVVWMQQQPNKKILEVSGGVNLETIADYAATGVDDISVGAITHSAPAIDISLNLL